MFERLAGVWLGIVILAGWSMVCIVLSLLFVGTAERIVIVGMWLLVVVPFSWALRKSRLHG